jgi:septal ring factor EnvC (AmiA/AmiB activator)
MGGLIRPVSFTLVLLLTATVRLPSQSNIEELKQEQSKLTKKIELANQLLAENHNRKQDTEEKLSLLSKQIETRRQLIRSIEREVAQVRERQLESEQEVQKLKLQKENLQGTYSTILQSSYRSKLLKNRWLFLFTAQSLPQLYRRWSYLRQLNSGVQKQLTQITATVQGIDLEIANLRAIEQEKQRVLQTQDRERKTLDLDVSKQKGLLTNLGQEEKKLKANIKDHHKAQEKLKKVILAAISESKGERMDLPLTPAMAKLSSSFSANKGQLPWPVARGLLTRSFGKQVHPTLKNVTIVNNGVDITTDVNSPVKAIFEGTVVGIQFIPGYDQMVIVSHGNFYTVYSYLSTTTVTKGGKIKTGDTLGVARDRNGSGQVHLEIWQGRELLNPETWLKDH